jgi:hypothetical protein
MHETQSIMLRVRRTRVEDAYVAVPVTDAIVDVESDGTGSINFEAFVAEALRISGNPLVEWQVESTEVATHPEQRPLPEGRRCFDAYYPSGKPE